MRRMLPTALAAAAFLAGPARSAEPPAPAASLTPLDARGTFAGVLPPEVAALAALEATPGVAKARALLGEARASERALRVGEHEFVLSGGGNERQANGSSYFESELQLSRTLRLPGKAALDREAGALGRRAAEDQVDDARHQAATALVDAWFDWIAATAAEALDRRSLDSAGADTAALRRRVELKDASLLELNQAEAAEARLAVQAAQSGGAAAAARLQLFSLYPGLPLPERPPALPDPADVLSIPWRERVLARSHEIHIAVFLADRERALARRARMDRLPDPTVGVRAFSDFGGREKGLGLVFSVPLPGGRRSAAADSAAARAGAAEADLAQVRRDVEALAQKDVSTVRVTRAAWQASDQAAAAARQAAQKVRRAYELGESNLTDALQAERLAYEGDKAALQARAEAWRALAHLWVDSHDLWGDGD